jgi:hypothetical protein
MDLVQNVQNLVMQIVYQGHPSIYLFFVKIRENISYKHIHILLNKLISRGNALQSVTLMQMLYSY